jgi:hypothetical protein
MKIEQFADLKQWAIEQWGTVELGDERRTHRAVEVGAAIAGNPGASLPEQMQGWGDLKAAYRLLSEAISSLWFDNAVKVVGLSLPLFGTYRFDSAIGNFATSNRFESKSGFVLTPVAD